ncbi:MAG TPA: hypothetical protein PK325_16885 [Cyclobacteriaceae bacterium]|nr:hypothetical protein [Cyclobacteriaceae bacterium]HMV08881.1 hypothetical protein [Cyclobacteriaceae bacterium]HMV89306.1 hypothetical protein [Cyclobacteriaceae bacterium]HMX00364.1 hypothetical protein [Cyclobacteriaceae bacterium]HMX49637.1 hypothetical protein [Cyclobacteriaceae bacterium]
MVMVLKKGSDKKSIQAVLKKVIKKSSKTGLRASQYAGTVKFKEDGLTLQKRWRDEWE